MDKHKQTIITMLNMLGDRSVKCPSNKEGCEGCSADAWAAWDEGLQALGYPSTSQGWQQMMRNNYEHFPSDEEIKSKIKEHIRCDEWDGTNTYVWVPDDWNEDLFDEKARNAQKAYLVHIEELKELKEPTYISSYNTHGHFKNNTFPDDMTIGEAKKMLEENETKRNEWSKKKDKANRGLLPFLMEQGMTPFYEIGSEEIEILSTDLNWGHRHGTNIKYDETKVAYTYMEAEEDL
jgi:hypothetical protein